MKTYLTNDIAIITRSRRDHHGTSDCDEQGYLIQNGTQRTLCTGIAAPDRDHHEPWMVVYMETNADPVLLDEGNEADFVDGLTDAPDHNPEPVYAILENLADELEAEDSDTADWLRDRIEAAKEASQYNEPTLIEQFQRGEGPDSVFIQLWRKGDSWGCLKFRDGQTTDGKYFCRGNTPEAVASIPFSDTEADAREIFQALSE